MRIAIVEDDEKDLRQLTDVLVAYAAAHDLSVEIDTFSSGENFLRAFEPQKYTLVFLDNYIGNGLGIDLARKARALDAAVALVFVSMSMDFALSGYEVRALHYLIKPATPEEMEKVFERLPQNGPEAKEAAIEVICDYRPILIPADSIRYIEVVGKACVIHAEKDVKTYMPLGSLIDRLPPDDFIRTHRSYVVRLSCIRAMHKNEFTLKDGVVVPISQSYHNNSHRAYIEYLATPKKRRNSAAKP